jgi:plastocyanin
MKKSTLRTAAAAAALATGLVTAATTSAGAAPAERPSESRITTSAQLAESIKKAVALEQAQDTIDSGGTVGFVSTRSTDATAC